MTLDLLVGGGAGLVSICSSIYAAICNQQIKQLKDGNVALQDHHLAQIAALQAGLLEWKKTASEWQARHEEDRKEIHDVRDTFNGELGLMRDQLEMSRIECAKLREQTNFAPVEKKLDVVIEEFRTDRREQAKINESFVSTLNKVAATMDVVIRLVPQVSQSILAEQEKPL